MSRRQSDLPKKSRERSLNVIYFTDANKTRSFSISARNLGFVVALLGLLVVWAGVSVVSVLKLAQDNRDLDKRRRDMMSIIFEYQSRFERVYENAYAVTDASANSKLSRSSAQAVQFAMKKRKERALVDKAIKLTNKYSQQDIEMSLGVEGSHSSWRVALEEPILSKSANSLEYDLSFVLRNIKTPSKSEGYIAGVAVFVDESGKEYRVTSPRGVLLDKEGQVTGVVSTFEYYGIKYYKSKNLIFQAPKKTGLFLSTIEIFLKDKALKQIKSLIKVEPSIRVKELQEAYRNLAGPLHTSAKPVQGGEVAQSTD